MMFLENTNNEEIAEIMDVKIIKEAIGLSEEEIEKLK